MKMKNVTHNIWKEAFYAQEYLQYKKSNLDEEAFDGYQMSHVQNFLKGVQELSLYCVQCSRREHLKVLCEKPESLFHSRNFENHQNFWEGHNPQQSALISARIQPFREKMFFERHV